MDDISFVVDAGSPVSLQHQLRQKLIDAIMHGVLRPGRRLPSSRRLSRQAGVSRNTVVLAYESLLAEGHLVSRQRSGVFVAEDASMGRLATRQRTPTRASPMTARLGSIAQESAGLRCPPNWDRYPYPFIDGRIDPGLLPIAEWREATRLAFSRHEALRWSVAGGEVDDEMLIDEIRSKILPARGIDAAPDEIMVTASARSGLQLVAELIIDRGTPVYLEDPADPELLRRIRSKQANVLIDARDSLDSLPRGTVVIASCRRFAPNLAANRALGQNLLQAAIDCDGLLIEHDVPLDVRDSQRVAPALRALDGSGRTIYVAGFSAIAAPGVAAGIVVADARFVERLRQLRNALGAFLPPGDQRAWAHFIRLGHYSAAVTRAARTLSERRTELRDALNYLLRKSVVIETFPGASAYRVRTVAQINAIDLARNAAAAGILIEPMPLQDERNVFCMGVTGIPKERIREGVLALSRLIRRDPAQSTRRLVEDPLPPLKGAALRQAMTGTTLFYNTVYGDPCTIEIRRDGSLVGVAGYSGEDCDTGRWWIEGDYWFRQWKQWAYGECTGFTIVIEGAQMRWYGNDGVLADTAVVSSGTISAARLDLSNPRQRR